MINFKYAVLPFLLTLTVLLALTAVSCSDAAVSHTAVSEASATDAASITVTEMITQTPDAASPETTAPVPQDSVQTEADTASPSPTIPEGNRQFGYVGAVETHGEKLSLLIHTMTAPDIQLTDQDRKELDLWISVDHATVCTMNETAISFDSVEIGDIIAYIPAPNALIQETYPASLTDSLLYLEILQKITNQ